MLLAVEARSSSLLGIASKPQISWFTLRMHTALENLKGSLRLARLSTVQHDECSSIRGFGEYKHIFTY